MEWKTLKNKYVADHLSKSLKAPKIRLNALERIEESLKRQFPEIIADPTILININKGTLKSKLAIQKKNGKLNGAEESVINGLYKIISNSK